VSGDRATNKADSPAPHTEANTEASGWFTDNVLHPFINGSGVRQVVDTITDTDYKPLYQAEPENILETATQTVSSVAGTIVPYIALGKIAHGGLKGVAERFEIEGAAGTILRNEAGANITAAGAYEFLKKPTDGQTRIGNSVGTMLSFAAYEGGGAALNKLTPMVGNKLLKGAVLGTGRAVIGAAGGEFAYDASNLIAAHTGGKNTATNDGRLQAMATGAVLNEALPVVHDGVRAFLSRGSASGVAAPVDARAGAVKSEAVVKPVAAMTDAAQSNSPTPEAIQAKASAAFRTEALNTEAEKAAATNAVTSKNDGLKATTISEGIRAKSAAAFDGVGKTISKLTSLAGDLLRGKEGNAAFKFNSNDGVVDAPALRVADAAVLAKDGSALLPKIEITDAVQARAGALDAHVGVPEVGATFTADGINFGINSPKATNMELLIYSTPDAKDPSQILPMYKTGDIWHRAEQLPEFTAYQFRASGPHTPDVDGTRFDDTVKLLDPEAKAVYNVNSGDAKAGDAQASDSRAIAVRPDTFDWQGVKKPGIKMDETIVYEMNVRGFTAGDASLGDLRGTYRGLIQKIPYLKKLGVTSVELMPVMEFQKDMKINPETGKMLINAWGYNTVGFKAVEGRYAHDGTTGQQVNEFKEMVRELHRNDIEVIMDVVFNHTGEGGADGKTINFKGLNNDQMYMLDKDNKYAHVDHTGCGNTVNANDPAVQDFIIRSLRYWANDMQVDGFRFDLAKALKYMPNGAFNDTAPLIEAIRNDPELSKVKLIAEPWDMSGYGPGRFAPGWAEWNGRFRDVVRRFVKGLTGQVKDLGDLVAGSNNAGFDPEKDMRPINFITAHDGFTLNDVVSYNEKHNESNGENNRDGNSDNDSSNYGVEGPVPKGSPIDLLRARQIKNFMTWLFSSEGTPMLLAGDEMRRTVDGNNNAYNQDDLNEIDWKLLEENPGVFNFAQQSIALRKDLNLGYMRPDDIIWHGTEPNKPDWSDGARFMARQFKAVGDANQTFYTAANAWEEPIDITLPPGTWQRVIDTNLPDFQDIKPIGQGDMMDSPNYRVMPHTTVGFVQTVPAGTARPFTPPASASEDGQSIFSALSDEVPAFVHYARD
jgi:isoamylase